MIYLVGNLNKTGDIHSVMQLNNLGQLEFYKIVLSKNLPVKSIQPMLEGIESIINKAKSQGEAMNENVKAKLSESGLILLLGEFYKPPTNKSSKNPTKGSSNDEEGANRNNEEADDDEYDEAEDDEDDEGDDDEDEEEPAIPMHNIHVQRKLHKLLSTFN